MIIKTFNKDIKNIFNKLNCARQTKHTNILPYFLMKKFGESWVPSDKIIGGKLANGHSKPLLDI